MKNLKLLSDFLFSFRGRINRRQWWAVRLFLILPALIGYYYYMEEFAWAYEWAELLGILFLIFIAYIDLSICAKRYHDFDKTGWRQFVGLIPLIGELWVSIECGFKEGNPDSNLYGYPNTIGKQSMYDRRKPNPFATTNRLEDRKIDEPVDRKTRKNMGDIYN